MFDELLERYGLKYSDLNSAERETYNSWVQSLETNQLTTEKIREYVLNIKTAIETDLAKVGHESNQDIFLKARLRNIMLIEACLMSPEKARQEMEKAIASFASSIGYLRDDKRKV